MEYLKCWGKILALIKICSYCGGKRFCLPNFQELLDVKQTSTFTNFRNNRKNDGERQKKAGGRGKSSIVFMALVSF